MYNQTNRFMLNTLVEKHTCNKIFKNGNDIKFLGW